MIPHLVVIPVLNGLELTRQIVKDILAQDVPTNILIIDNGSTDDTSHFLRNVREQTGRLGVISPGFNLGVGPSWNEGAREAWSEGLDQVFIFNNDIRIRPDTIRTLAAQPGGLVSAANMHTYEAFVNAGVGDLSIKGGPDFSCFMLRREFWEALGGFPECFYPAYFEDNFTDYKAHQLGLGDQIYSIQFPYYHIGSQTIALNPELAELNAKCFVQNLALYERMFGGRPHHEKFTTPFNQGHWDLPGKRHNEDLPPTA